MGKIRKIQRREVLSFFRNDKSEKSFHLNLNKRQKIIGLILISIIILFSIVIFLINYNSQIMSDKTKQVINKANDSLYSNKTDGEKAAAFDEAIILTDKDEQKSVLYVNKAIVYMNSEDYKKALEAAKQAEELAPDQSYILAMIAKIYVGLDDKSNAITYYEKAISKLDSTSFSDSETIEDYKYTIESLKGGN